MTRCWPRSIAHGDDRAPGAGAAASARSRDVDRARRDAPTPAILARPARRRAGPAPATLDTGLIERRGVAAPPIGDERVAVLRRQLDPGRRVPRDAGDGERPVRRDSPAGAWAACRAASHWRLPVGRRRAADVDRRAPADVDDACSAPGRRPARHRRRAASGCSARDGDGEPGSAATATAWRGAHRLGRRARPDATPPPTGDVRAPMPGRCCSSTSPVGDQRQRAATVLLVIESMKMELLLTAPRRRRS